MRTIKFRGKRTDNGEWVYGDLLRPNAIFSDSCFAEPHCPCTGSEIQYVLQLITIETSSIGQFTGLLDKNGKEIFEGDIFKYTGHWSGDCWINEGIEVVEFDDGSFNLDATRIYNEDIVVVGNIHDNPELIANTDTSAHVQPK